MQEIKPENMFDKFHSTFTTMSFYGKGNKEQSEAAKEMTGKFTEDSRELPKKIETFFRKEIENLLKEIVSQSFHEHGVVRVDTIINIAAKHGFKI